MSAKSASIVQRIIVWVIVLGVLAGVGYCVWTVANQMNKKYTTVDIGKGTFRAEVANTDETRARGLGGRQELGKSEGMLFVTEKDGDIPIWMKDMRIPIDIIWLDAKKKVVHVKRDAWPDNEPHEVYHTPVPARYVLELPAGSAKEHSIKPGVTARFSTEAQR